MISATAIKALGVRMWACTSPDQMSAISINTISVACMGSKSSDAKFMSYTVTPSQSLRRATATMYLMIYIGLS